jgi:hypothetical protein
MGLYLCVFADEEELEGLEVGSYADFDSFRTCVTDTLEGGQPGSKYPTLINHSDCDGEWTPAQCAKLREEVASISEACKRLPPVEFQGAWQKQVAKSLGLKPVSLYGSFIDVDGEPLLERLEGLCDVAIRSGRAILFQ